MLCVAFFLFLFFMVYLVDSHISLLDGITPKQMVFGNGLFGTNSLLTSKESFLYFNVGRRTQCVTSAWLCRTSSLQQLFTAPSFFLFGCSLLDNNLASSVLHDGLFSYNFVFCRLFTFYSCYGSLLLCKLQNNIHHGRAQSFGLETTWIKGHVRRKGFCFFRVVS